ncbi:MAG TPA: hypothetical protein VMW35_09700 [Myxococcota bacterium]|jgi:hypothetical protein|nr:hypothetical protein [Myxococcota bacterium]
MEPSSLAHLGLDDFARCVGERFRVAVPGAELELELLRADPIPARDRGPRLRQPFSLVFLSPEDRVLPQRIYRLEHAALGALEIFLVPIGRDERGVRYEAVFA